MSESLGVHLRRLILPVYLPMMLVSVAISAPSAAFPQYLGALGASVAAVGIVISLRGFGNLASDLPGGLVIGRFPVGAVLKIALLLAAVSSVAMAFVKSVAAVGVLVLLTGFMSSIVVTGMMTYVRVRIPADNRGRALSLVGGSVRIGAVIGPLAGGLLTDSVGFESAILLRAGCYMLAFFAIALNPNFDPPAVPADPSAAAPAGTTRLRNQIRAVISGLAGRRYALLTVGVGIVILQLLRSSRSILLPLWGAELSLSATVIGSVMSAGAILDLILFVPSGIIMDRAGRKVAAGLCIGVFSTGVLVLGFTSGIPGFVLASLIIGLGNGFGAGINMTIGTDLAPDGAVSEFIGLWRLFGDVGTTVGPAVIGALAGAGGLGLAITVAALVGYTGLGALLAGPETLQIARRSSIAPD